MTLVTHTFIVSGRGHFPLDMLRRDCCYPAREIDAGRAQDYTATEPRFVACERLAPTYWVPTAARWKSFGWTVTEHHHTRRATT